MALLIHLQAQISEGEHVPGEIHKVCDGMSRDLNPADFGFTSDRTVDFHKLQHADTLLRICDPRAELVSDNDLVAVWSEVYALVREFE